MQPKLIVFDLDGTLYISESSFVPAVKEFLERHNRPLPPIEFIYRFIGEPDHVFEEWLETLKIDAPLKELFREFDDLERDAVIRDGCLYDSVAETLEWLTNKDYFITLKTPRSKDETKTVMLRDIAEAVKPSISYMVGDRIHDITAAREAGYISVGAAYGYGGEEIKDADYIISHLKEIKGILR